METNTSKRIVYGLGIVLIPFACIGLAVPTLIAMLFQAMGASPDVVALISFFFGLIGGCLSVLASQLLWDVYMR